MRKPIIGLTGAIGAGKSTVARQLASLGCAVIDADVLAKQALDEPMVRRTLVQWWGDGLLDGKGRIDRKALAALVFADEQKLRRLESLTHPLVHAERARLREQYQADAKVKAIVEDVPLLHEKGLADQVDVIVHVEASEAVRLARVAQARGWDASELARRQKNQLPPEEKKARADYVIDNEGDEAHCLVQVRRVLGNILGSPAP